MNNLRLIAIQTKVCVYISSNIEDNTWNRQYYNLANLMFDGEKPKSTYRIDWFEVSKVPSKVENFVPAKETNKRWNLKSGFPETINTPWYLEYGTDEEEFDDRGFLHDYYEFYPLYELKFDLTEPSHEEIPFEITVIAEEDEFKIIKEDFKVEYNLLDQINTHPVMLNTKPCKLSSEQSYKIIRMYLLENIDQTVAKMVDYDFCLTVTKFIPLAVPEEYDVDVNYDLFSKKQKKPKYETRYRVKRDLQVFETAPNRPRDGVYKGYTRTKEFEGKNYEDMLKNIQTYLDNLIKEINRPLVDCPHCKGYGVIEKEK
jgi:hypothetical protein